MTMAKYETPPPVRPLEKLITDFSYTNGLDPVNVLNDLLTYIIHGFSPGAPPTAELEIQTAAEHEIHGNGHRMGTAHGKPDKGLYKLV